MPRCAACQPDVDGYAERDGVKLAYEVHGAGRPPTVLLLPDLVDRPLPASGRCRCPYLARHFRVVTFDGRGNGRSDRPAGAAALPRRGVRRRRRSPCWTPPAPTGRCWSACRVAVRPWALAGRGRTPTGSPGLSRSARRPRSRRDHDAGGRHRSTERARRHRRAGPSTTGSTGWRADYDDFARLLLRRRCFPEPHSTKPIEDAVGWARTTDPETLSPTRPPAAARRRGRPAAEALCARIALPGAGGPRHRRRDLPLRPGARPWPSSPAARLSPSTAAGTGPRPRPGHGQPADQGVRRAGSAGAAPSRRPGPGRCARPKRALYLSSPIGLGHARRDLAIAHELRSRTPTCRSTGWPSTRSPRVLDAGGERVHPASRAGWPTSRPTSRTSAAEHDLHAFQAIRRMDEILLTNFMVFHDLVDAEHYDLVIGDEAWDVDHFLHENPELKRSAFAWMTDFVGWLPDARRRRRPRRRSPPTTTPRCSSSVPASGGCATAPSSSATPTTSSPDRFGPDLPAIRDWTERSSTSPATSPASTPPPTTTRGAAGRARLPARRAGLPGHRRRLRRRRRRCCAGVSTRARWPRRRPRPADGRGRRAPHRPRVAARPEAGLELHPYVPDLHRHLAACDIAVVQGGLTTCMELTANRRPFIYVPLRHHFEQNFHVATASTATAPAAACLRRPRPRLAGRRDRRRDRPPRRLPTGRHRRRPAGRRPARGAALDGMRR